MKNRNFMGQLGDFVLGKGFYIVLFLCVAAIGVSGFYLIRSVDLPDAQTTAGDSSVILPDSEANGPDPVDLWGSGEVETPVQSVTAPGPVEVPEPGEKPEIPELPKEPELPGSQEEKKPAPGKPAAAVYTWPVKGEILRSFSVETLSPDPTMGDWRTHAGVDISAELGTKVMAMSDGTVEQVCEDGLMGTTVVIDHGEGLTSIYCNLAEEPAVKVGDRVTTGAFIGAVGDTAIAEVGLRSHLHLEVCLDEKAVDPAEYLPELG